MFKKYIINDKDFNFDKKNKKKKRTRQFKTNLYIPAMYSKLTPYLQNDLQVQLLR